MSRVQASSSRLAILAICGPSVPIPGGTILVQAAPATSPAHHHSSYPQHSVISNSSSLFRYNRYLLNMVKIGCSSWGKWWTLDTPSLLCVECSGIRSSVKWGSIKCRYIVYVDILCRYCSLLPTSRIIMTTLLMYHPAAAASHMSWSYSNQNWGRGVFLQLLSSLSCCVARFKM